MNEHYEFLVEKEEMWARMLTQVLEDNLIPCTALPVHGAGFLLRTGMQESMKVYVPAEHLEKARELLDELFSGVELPEE